MVTIILYDTAITIVNGSNKDEIPVEPCYRVYKEIKDNIMTIEIDKFEGTEFLTCCSNNILLIDNRNGI